MRHLFCAVLITLSAPFVLAAGWNKAYFGATKPGSFAKYEVKSTLGPSSTSNVTRLADQAGRVRIEERTESPGSPVATNRYEMAKGFVPEQDLIDYPKALVAASAGAGNEPLAPLPAGAVASMKKIMSQYAPTAVFKATETVGGKSCDRYTYSLPADGASRIETGDLWLSETVPFGLVKKTSTTKDAAGKVVWTIEQTLLDSGNKSLPPPTKAPRPTRRKH